MLSKIRWNGLRMKIIAWSFVPTIILLFAVALVIFIAFRQVTETLALERDAAVTYVSASQLTTTLEEYTDRLAALARNPAMYQENPAIRRAALERARNRFVVFDAGVLLLDTYGVVRLGKAVPSGSTSRCRCWLTRTSRWKCRNERSPATSAHAAKS